MCAAVIPTIVMVVVSWVIIGLTVLVFCPVYPVTFQVIFEDPSVAFFPGEVVGTKGRPSGFSSNSSIESCRPGFIPPQSSVKILRRSSRKP